MKPFVYDAPAHRVVFGAGALGQLAAEVARLGAARALVLATPEQEVTAREASEKLGTVSAGVYAKAVMHVPIETARAAREEAKRLGADCCIAVGGGSTVGLAKAIALESEVPIIAVPTTYAGSEMTPIWGITEAGVKKTGKDRRVLPKAVLYDPELTLTLPAKVAGPSGMNAIAHCVEGLYAQDANPVMTLMAAEGIRALAKALPVIMHHPDNMDARAEALYGAWLAGTVLGGVGMAIHHKLCHTLGGTFNLPHAEVHTVILPHATAYNRHAATELWRASEALGAGDAAEGLYDLAKSIGAPLSLKEIGMPADGLDRAADLAVQNPYYNPRPIERVAIRELLQNAYEGKRP